MGLKRTDFNDSVEQFRKGLGNFSLEQLKTLGLTIQQISTQTPEELKTSLETVNHAIEYADSFGVFSVKISATGSSVLIDSSSKTESHFEMGILPLLLESKKLILERLAEIRKQEQIDNLEQLVNRVSDDSVREKLSLELSELNSQLTLWRNKFDELENQKSQQIDSLQAYSTEQMAQLTNTLKSVRRGRAIYRTLLGFLIGTLGISVILSIPHLLNWQWFLSHPKRVPIQVSLCLITLGLSWLIVDSSSKRRWFVFGSIIVAASLGLLGLL